MTLTVRVESWQQECCADTFRIGSTVSWTLIEPDEDWLGPLFPPQTGVTIARAEEHHGGQPDDAPVTTGVVRSIRAVRIDSKLTFLPEVDLPTPGGRDLGCSYPQVGSSRLLHKERGCEGHNRPLGSTGRLGPGGLGLRRPCPGAGWQD